MCCREITQIVNKKAPEEVGCIILHPGFQNVCLNHRYLKQPIIATGSTMEQMQSKEPSMSIFRFSQLCFKVYCLQSYNL